MRPIAFFDSGIGGLSVLSTAYRLLPDECFVYYGDSARAPYGSRTPEEISAFTVECVGRLAEHDMKALVIACNTATSVAIERIRAWLQIPVISMEPAIKPAFEQRKDGRVAVMATPATLSQPRFLRLRGRIDPNNEALLLPCSGLVELIEKGDFKSQEIFAYLEDLFAPHKDQKLDSVVLGCTHFVLIAEAVRSVCERLYPGISIVDGNEGTVRHLARVLDQRGMLNSKPYGGDRVVFFSSGDADRLRELFDGLIYNGERLQGAK
jgi:glutamate racemase